MKKEKKKKDKRWRNVYIYIYLSVVNKERKKGSKKKEINVARCLAGGPSS